MDAHAMLGTLVIILYLAAALVGAAALWKSGGARWMYLLTLVSTFVSLRFAMQYFSYINRADYLKISDDFGWGLTHLLGAVVLIGFHSWRLRRPV